MFERMFNISKNITKLIHLGVKMPKYDFQHKMHVPVKIEWYYFHYISSTSKDRQTQTNIETIQLQMNTDRKIQPADQASNNV